LYGIGGYNENSVFIVAVNILILYLTKSQENTFWHRHMGQRRYTCICPLGGMVHSFAYNDQFGDYGATIVLLHQLDGMPFYTLYGHLSLKILQH
jgi:hypothetical protein